MADKAQAKATKLAAKYACLRAPRNFKAFGKIEKRKQHEKEGTGTMDKG
jgi:hypothetical protein